MAGPMWLTVLLLSSDSRGVVHEPCRAERDDQTGARAGCWFHDGDLVPFDQYRQLAGGKAASLYSSMPLPELFGSVAVFSIAAAVVLVLLVRPTIRLMGGVN